MSRSAKSPWQAEWERALRQEARFLKQAEGREPALLNRMLADKVPEKLRETLTAAFSRAFDLVLNRGTGLIEKSCARPRREADFQVRQYAAGVKGDRRSLRACARAAGAAGRKNLLLSGVEGVGLGLLGVGLPDIPLFTAVLLKSLYETALDCGCGYDTPEERIFLLRLIRGALSREGRQLGRTLEDFMRTGRWPEGVTVEQETAAAARCLSDELLYLKFLQGIPIAGAVGGAGDALCLRRVQRYAGIQYQKRFLLGQRAGRDGT